MVSLWLLKAVPAVALGYGLLVGALYLGQRWLIYAPFGGSPGAPAAYGLAEMREVRVRTADGLALLAWYAPAPEGRPVIVYLHGNAGHIGYRAEKVRPYLAAGLGMLLLSYRGYGGNPGRPTEDGLYADGRGALAFLEAEGVAPARWVLYGESLGAAVAVRLAAERAARAPVGALVLEAPFTSLADAAAYHYPFVPARRLVKDRYDTLSRIAEVAAPLLIVHGRADSIVPPEMGERLLAAAREPKAGRFVAGAGHNDLHESGLARMAIDFIRERLMRK